MTTVNKALEDLPPRALILTVLGAYVRELQGWISIAALIDLLGELGVPEQAVRSAISRLKRRGIVVPERRDGCAGYSLSDEGARVLGEGDTRIFQRPLHAPLKDGWVLAVFSVPDSERGRRHQLRTTLAWLGFGNVASGVWLAPAYVEPDARAALRRAELDRYVQLFGAQHLGFSSARELVRDAWSLDDLAERYRRFLRVSRPVLARWADGRAPDDRQAFVDYVAVLTHWRALPFLDPGLPVEALPSKWPGTDGWTSFQAVVRRLRAPALAHVRAAVRPASPAR